MTEGDDARELSITSDTTRRSVILLDVPWQTRVRELGPRRLLVADATLDRWANDLAGDIGADGVMLLELGEEKKTLGTVERVYSWLSAQGATRDTVVAALGGGTCTDLVGFACATYLRGIAWAAIPTSLLAQVDAAIGGKVGVNTVFGKNLVGAFHLPQMVAVDTKFLSTLPLRQWRAGLGEVLKSALIQGGWLYDILSEVDLEEGSVGVWAEIVRETAKIKVALVNQDLYESGPRMFLNLGHTIGHAIENLLGYGVMTHGEAIGLGTLAALRLSERTRGLSPAVRERVSAWLTRWGLPKVMPALEFSRLWQQLYRDKKARTGGLTWVLLEDVGRPVLVRELDAGLVRSVVEELKR